MMVLCGVPSASAGTIYFTGSGDANQLTSAWDFGSGITYSSNSIHFGNAGTTTADGTGNLVDTYTEVSATTLAGMGTLTIILTEAHEADSGYGVWAYLDRDPGNLLFGIGDSSEDGGAQDLAYLSLEGTGTINLAGSAGASAVRLSSDGTNLTLEASFDFGATWTVSESHALASLSISGLSGATPVDHIGFGAWHEPFGGGEADAQAVCQISW